MSQDISQILDGWDFDPHELNVRIVVGEDDNQKIQMRLDLGLLQMNIAGRPDGRQPHGCESLLEFYENEALEYGEDYCLGNESLEELFQEGLQYYHRYLCLFHLSNYELVVRDTQRNLRLFDFVCKHAAERREKWRFDQHRPYVVMMCTRAQAMTALQAKNRAEAMLRIEEGRQQIIDFFAERGKDAELLESFELDFLTHWYEELRDGEDEDDAELGGVSEISELRLSLKRAIDREDYEYAALLRDQLKRLEWIDPEEG